METESNLLKVSILMTAVFAILGIVFGFILNSEIIIFDGIYSLGGIFLSLVSLFGSIYINKDKENKFLDKKLLKELIVIFKSLVIFVMCIYSILSAVIEIFNGGKIVSYDYILIYIILSIIGSLMTYIFLNIKGKKINSSFVNIESSQWLMDSFLSLGILIGFLIGGLLKNTEFFWINKYLDQLMVIICSIAFLKMPLKFLKDSIKNIISYKKEKFLKKNIVLKKHALL